MSAIERLLKTTHLSRKFATPDTQRKTAGWNVWLCAESVFSHYYDREVSFLVKAGSAVIKLSTGESVDVQAGDFVTIQPGVAGQWSISAPLENRYCYHDTFDIADCRASMPVPEVHYHGQ
jgi:uncharacterized cupin superfamily protein